MWNKKEVSPATLILMLFFKLTISGDCYSKPGT